MNRHDHLKSNGAAVNAKNLAGVNPPIEQIAQKSLPETLPIKDPESYTFPSGLGHICATANFNWNTSNTTPYAGTQTPMMPPQMAFPSQQVTFPEAENRSEAEAQTDWSENPTSLSPQPATFPSPSSDYTKPINQTADNMPMNPISMAANKPLQPPARLTQQEKGIVGTIHLGFTIAGLCVFAGGFLLLFIYLIGQGFLLGNESVQSTLKTTTPLTQTSSNPAVQAQTAVTASPTSALPAQDLLDTATLASQFDIHTGQIIQQATTFTVGQNFYIVFSLHPGGQSKLVCLNWYLNNQSVSTLSIEVDSTSNNYYYSYTSIQATGQGRVDISAASTGDCTTALLARQLSFTIS